MALAATNVKVQVSTDDTLYTDIADINDISWGNNGNLIETTDFSSAGWREKLQGLKDVSCSLSGFYNPSDTTGQVVLSNAFVNGTSVYIKYLVDGTKGFKCQFKVASFEVGATVDGEVSVSFSLESTAALSVLTA